MAGFTLKEKAAVESKINGPLENKVIPLKEGAQAYTATYMKQPEWAKKNPKRIFLSADDSGYFDRVFSNELTAEKFVAAYKLAQCVNEYVKQFMTRKRRKERVSDWRNDYKEFLGGKLVDAHGTTIDQVIPQSALFLTALVFDLRVTNQGNNVDALIQELKDGNGVLNSLIFDVIEVARDDSNLAKSWPTLLKSQPFFEKVASFERGRVAQGADRS